MAAPGMALPRTPLAGFRTGTAPLGLRFLLIVFLLAHFGFARTLWAEPLQQVVLPPAGQATEAGWAVVALSGPVVYRGGARRDWQTLSRSQILRPDFEVITGAGGFAKLVRAQDQITIGENAHLVFPASDPLKAKTSIFQLLGSAFFEVTKRRRWSFEVRTPFLAAVVKGTSFQVSVARTGAGVEVRSGLVGVSAEGGGSVDVTPGRTASVAAGRNDLAVGPTTSAPLGPKAAKAAAAAAAAARAEAAEKAKAADGAGFSRGGLGDDGVDRSDRGNSADRSRARADRRAERAKDYGKGGKGDRGDRDDDDDGDDSDDDD